MIDGITDNLPMFSMVSNTEHVVHEQHSAPVEITFPAPCSKPIIFATLFPDLE